MQPGSGRGRSHGTSAAQPFDRWFRYPAGFASDYVALLLDRIHLDEGLVLDCFMGSGVTGTAAHARGLGFVGLEAHPLIAELAKLKLQPPASSEALLDLADSVSLAAREDVVTRLALPMHERSEVEAEPADPSSYPWLLSETELVRRSFDPAVLAELVSLRDAIKPLADNPLSVYLKWALLATLRDVAGVKVGWPYQRPGVSRAPRYKDAPKRFLARVKTMAEDLNVAPSGTVTHISLGNAADSQTWELLPSSQACVTSPPYLNNFDYADATRLELYFWGEIRSWRQMCHEVRGDMLTATTQQSSKAQKASSLDHLIATYGSTGAEVAALTKSLEDARGNREGRSKEYDQVLPAYFTAMGAVLTNAFDNLDSGSAALWLIGDSAPYDVFIDTPALIGRLASEIGFENKEDVLLRTRGHRWSKPTAPPLSERMIVLRKP
ncbi:DNA methyltransferase [Aeromicrobium sp. Leaf291]|uniref:DNA methyltransferase n=1 Tax=Aeromicrobium sp. Leaf291 TaxID=1736325 RepID=UPI002100B9DB|nr:DNA methyltransferase [Aeromicrobium sp. Leaf291]